MPHLVDEQSIRKHHLLHRLIHCAIWLDFIQVLLDVIHIHQAYHTVQSIVIAHLWIQAEGEANWCWIGKTCTLLSW